MLISESMALKKNIRPGDHLSFGATLGEDWEVLGVYYDYGNPYNQVIMSYQSWKKGLNGHGDVGLAIQLSDHTNMKNLMDRLESHYHLPPERIMDNSNIHSQAMRVFNRTFDIADTLGKLTLFVGVFGIFFATIAGEMSRQRYIAMLRCFGMSSKELIILSGVQLFIFGAISALIAVPLGLSVAKTMVDTVLKHSFGWSIQFHMMPSEYLGTLAWTMAALMIAGVLPLSQLVRRTPIKLLRDAL